MATQTRLHLNSFHLDAKSREAGRRGLEKARAALAEATAKNAAKRREDLGDDHAHAA